MAFFILPHIVVHKYYTYQVFELLIFLATFVTYLITIMNTRLKQFLAAENITQSQFADKLEVVRASVSHVLSGRNNPSYEFIKAIMAKYPALNMEWLMFGKGRMYKENPIGQQEDLLFNDFYSDSHDTDRPAADVVSPEESSQSADSPSEEVISPILLKDLVESSQNIVKQRSVSKIIILFDDGSYQEL
ncbi:MAG: helix-turn-helix transcriptional regulator [Bacteroidales bacterium]|nr:helix-turn-helix transcriptional regulator [Bacteroidales bacterium]MBQ9723012.1 helix-turn-helix transcriptional regulator [Bacteroidales bacterium]